MHQCINASRVFVVFCKPILAILLQRKHKLRDSRPVAQSRPVQCSQAAEVYSTGLSLLLFSSQIARFGTITRTYCWFEPLPELQNGNFSVENGIFFSARIRTVKTVSSPAREALQTSGGRVSIVGVQISLSRSSMHLAVLLCFVNPSLQCCYKENIRRS